MTNAPPRRPNRLRPRNVALSDEAIGWIIRLGSGTVSDAERTEFEGWVARSPAHAAAMAEARALFADIGHTSVAARHADTPAPQHGAFQDKEQTAANSMVPPAQVSSSSHAPSRSRISRRAMMTGGVAAAFAASLLIGGLFNPLPWIMADEHSGVGERRVITLADGSTIWLNSGTALSHNFSARERRLTLHQGEALFNVAKDPARPFIVTAGGGEARAIGTRYSVRLRDESTEVIVTEGVVEVQREQDQTRLIAGQRLAYGHGVPGDVRPADVDAAMAWTRGKLIFNHMPLAEVAAEAERYQHGAIIVMGSNLRQTKVTGLFELDDPDALLRAISASTGAKILKLPMLTIIR